MDKTRYIRRILLSIALLVCLTGCSSAYETEPPSTAPPAETTTSGSVRETEETAQTTTPATEPGETGQAEEQQPQTGQTGQGSVQPTQGATETTLPGDTKPVETKPVETQPEETQPEATYPIDTIQPQPVISRVVAAMDSRMQAATYDASCSGGTTVRLPIPPKQTEQVMAERLVGYLLEVFDDPDAAYTYKLGYQGFDSKENNHVFIVTYKIDVEFSQEATLDTAAVVAQATQKVLGSDSVEVSTFDGSGYVECVSIRAVPHFYNTDEAIDCLADEVETKIYTKNLQGAGYTQFRIAYDSKEDTCYVFLLYLR